MRRRYDSLKYDIKKIEEGDSAACRSSHRDSNLLSVVYDVSLRKLAPPQVARGEESEKS